jgi:hypothetical protein
MRKLLFFLLAILTVLFACNTSNTNRLISQDNLPTQEYTIDINRDTVLVTKNGALLKIPKGALVTSKGNTVTLAIKEAYSIQQIIEGGMITRSNGEPLSSGGMIYINAVGGQEVKITQPIKVATPADFIAEGMQLYKGEKDENGNINWKEPTALPENKQATVVQQGAALFQSKCGQCHGIGADMTGPNLAHFMKRFPLDDLNDDVRRYGKYYDHAFRYAGEAELDHYKADTSKGYFFYNHEFDDPYFIYKCNLHTRYGSIIGPAIFNKSNGQDLLAIYRYVQNESDRQGLPLPSHAYLFDCADSCIKYKQTVSSLQQQKQSLNEKKSSLIEDNDYMVTEKNEPATPDIPPSVDTLPSPPVDFEEKVSPESFGASYYQFSIETFGWYNIDMLVKGVNGVEESELFVRITGEYKEKVQVYLIIPNDKIYTQGGASDRGADQYAFHLKNGKIPLPQNKEAYILALTERKESIAFALKKFTTSRQQEFDISLEASSKEAFTHAISQVSMNEMTIKVSDAKNAKEIRKSDKEIKQIENELKKAESLKPKNCNCDCGMPFTASITNEITADSLVKQ